jgi:hypothetical protein
VRQPCGKITAKILERDNCHRCVMLILLEIQEFCRLFGIVAVAL